MDDLKKLVRSYLDEYDIVVDDDEIIEQYIKDAVESQLKRDDATGAFNDWADNDRESEVVS